MLMGSNPTFTHKTSLWNNTSLKICNILLDQFCEIGNCLHRGLIQLVSFEQLKKHILLNKEFWKYLQLLVVSRQASDKPC